MLFSLFLHIELFFYNASKGEFFVTIKLFLWLCRSHRVIHLLLHIMYICLIYLLKSVLLYLSLFFCIFVRFSYFCLLHQVPTTAVQKMPDTKQDTKYSEVNKHNWSMYAVHMYIKSMNYCTCKFRCRPPRIKKNPLVSKPKWPLWTVSLSS